LISREKKYSFTQWPTHVLTIFFLIISTKLRHPMSLLSFLLVSIFSLQIVLSSNIQAGYPCIPLSPNNPSPGTRVASLSVWRAPFSFRFLLLPLLTLSFFGAVYPQAASAHPTVFGEWFVHALSPLFMHFQINEERLLFCCHISVGLHLCDSAQVVVDGKF